MILKQYQFSQEQNEMLVSAIVNGYRKYIDHRSERKEKMAISSAFAWTKENFIESEIAEASKPYGFTYERSKAGPTWDYLQFIHHETESVFLMKNASSFNPESFANSKIPIPGQSRGNSRTYLQELALINREIKFSEDNKPDTSKPLNQGESLLSYIRKDQISEQLTLFKSKYHSFHVLTYQLDRVQQVSQIMHYAPNPANNIAYLIEDLSDYISGATLTEEERLMIAPENEGDQFDPEVFDLGILE